MKILSQIVLFLLASIVAQAANDADAVMAKLAAELADGISQAGCKKVSVIDFTDLQGKHSDLGRFMAEDLSVWLVNSAKGFSVMDRANLKFVLDEHKLTASGLVDPKNAQDLGRFAGVDGIILGTLTPLGDSLSVTVKVISTETTQVLAAKRANLPKTREFEAMLKPEASPPTAPPSIQSKSEPQSPPVPPKPAIEPATFQNVIVEVVSFKIANGGRISATVKITNRNKVNSLRVGLNTYPHGGVGAFVTDDENNHTLPLSGVSGLSFSRSVYGSAGNHYQVLRKLAAAAIRHEAQRRDLSEELDKATDVGVSQSILFTLVFEARVRFQLGSTFTLNAELIVAEILNGGSGANVSLNNAVIRNLRP